MTTRLLPPEEWPRLAGTLLEKTWPTLPADARVVVVERDGAIVACSALFAVLHQEGTWTAPEHRTNPAVGRHLIRAMREEIKATGATEVWMMATTPETSALCQRFGPCVRLDAEHFAVQVEG